LRYQLYGFKRSLNKSNKQVATATNQLQNVEAAGNQYVTLLRLILNFLEIQVGSGRVQLMIPPFLADGRKFGRYDESIAPAGFTTMPLRLWKPLRRDANFFLY
jgi:hypothetical protein